MLVSPEFPTSVTVPDEKRVGERLHVDLGAPARSSTSMMSVSSTSTSTSMCDMSEIVMMTVPGWFIVPVTTFSPSSTFSRVTTPSIGEWKTVLSSWSSAALSEARASSTACP